MMSHPTMDIPPARPRPRPQRQEQPNVARESSALRASVLDAAMQLGLGNNPAVADWMFNNQLKEEDEDQMLTSPGLTHSEESPSSSPLSARYPLTPSSPSSQNHTSSSHHGQKYHPGNFHLQHAATVPFAISPESHSLIPHITDPVNAPARSSTPSKLKKKRSGNRDDYESDGGAISDAKRKKDKKDKEKYNDSIFTPPMPAFSSMPNSSANSFLTMETASELTVDGHDPRKLKKAATKNSSSSRSAPVSPFESSMGYETDSSKKSKKKSKKSGDDEVKEPKKSKSLFFRLGGKSSKELKKGGIDTAISVQVEKNFVPPPLPIAERFAKTLNKETGAPMISLGRSGSQSGGSGTGTGLGIDLALGLSGDMFSTTYAPPPKPKMPPRPKTADSIMSSSTHMHFNGSNQPPPLPSSTISPHMNSSSPPVSFPPPSFVTSYGPRPGSAGTSTTSRTSTSTNTNTHSYSTGATRTSYATSVSTSQSHSPHPPKGSMLSREFSNPDVPSLASALSSNSIPPVPQTPSRRRPLPFLGTPGNRGSASSGDSVEKEKKREDNSHQKEKERDSEREKEGKKPIISLPLTRAPSEGPEVIPTPPNLMRNLSGTSPGQAPPSSFTPAAPLRPPRVNPASADGSLANGVIRTPSHPPVSHHLHHHNGLSRQISMSQLQSQPQSGHPILSRQISLSTLRPDPSSGNGRASPIPMNRSTSPFPSGRSSPLRGPGTNGKGSPPTPSRMSPLAGPPNVFAHYDIPPPSPPPLAPLPSVPIAVSPVPSTPVTPNNGVYNGSVANGHLAVNIGIAVTTGSPLPSPFLMTSPNFNGGQGGVATGPGTVPPTSFNPTSAAAGNALRAKVQRRLSQQDGFPTPSSSVPTSPAPDAGTFIITSSPPASIIPIINEPTLSRTTSIRGRESPFPVSPVSAPKGQSPTYTLAVNNSPLPSRAVSPRSGWDDDSSDRYIGAAGGEVEYDDDEMDDVRGVLARFRESRFDGDPRKRMDGRNTPDGAKALMSFETYQQNSVIAPSGSGSSLNGNMPVSPSPSSNVLGGNSDTGSGRYDSFVIDEYYGHGGASSGGMGAGPSSFAAFENEDLGYEDDDGFEDESHYPDDEIPTSSNRRSRRRRSTVYLSDEDSSNGHGHDNGKERSRYSASIYSRASFLDGEKSGDARQRFLKHVEMMLDERGHRVPAVPPVPKLPEEFVAESKRAAAVAKELVMHRTVGVGARKVPVGLPVNVGR